MTISPTIPANAQALLIHDLLMDEDARMLAESSCGNLSEDDLSTKNKRVTSALLAHLQAAYNAGRNEERAVIKSKLAIAMSQEQRYGIDIAVIALRDLQWALSGEQCAPANDIKAKAGAKRAAVR